MKCTYPVFFSFNSDPLTFFLVHTNTDPFQLRSPMMIILFLDLIWAQWIEKE